MRGTKTPLWELAVDGEYGDEESQRKQVHDETEWPPIRSQLRLMAMNEAPEVDIKVRQDTYASAFNSFIPRLFYMSRDPSPVYLCDLCGR